MKIKLTKYQPCPHRIRIGTQGSYGVESIELEYNEDWEGLAKKVCFYPADGSDGVVVTLVENIVDIPAEMTAVAGVGKIVVEGFSDDKKILSTTIITIVEETENGASNDPVPPTPTEIEQLMTAANEAKRVAASVEKRANDGKFNGADGASFEIFSTVAELKAYPAETTATAVRFIWAGEDIEYLYLNVTATLKKYGVYDGKMGVYLTKRSLREITEVIVLSGGGVVDQEKLKELVDAYLADNPPEGDPGKSAYEYAKEGGYTGSEEEFAEKLAKEIPNVYDWAKQPNKPEYTAEEVGADPNGTAEDKIAKHNISPTAHGEIRHLITELSNRLNAIADSEDVDLDQLSELVACIKSNRDLIDIVTTSKVSVAAIVDNLTTPAANQPLSAAQGVEIKDLIDALKADKLDATALNDAINTALAQAKGSGEFEGADGVDGYTPVKGTDYFTEADKTEMVNAVIAALPTTEGVGF